LSSDDLHTNQVEQLPKSIRKEHATCRAGRKQVIPLEHHQVPGKPITSLLVYWIRLSKDAVNRSAAGRSRIVRAEAVGAAAMPTTTAATRNQAGGDQRHDALRARTASIEACVICANFLPQDVAPRRKSPATLASNEYGLRSGCR